MISWKYLPIVCYVCIDDILEVLAHCMLCFELVISWKYLPTVCNALNQWYPGNTCPLYVMLLIDDILEVLAIVCYVCIDDILEVLAHCMLCFVLVISWKYLPIVCYAFNRWYPESTCTLYVMLWIGDILEVLAHCMLCF